MNHNELGQIIATAFLGLTAYAAYKKDAATFLEPENLAAVIVGIVQVWHPAQLAASGANAPTVNNVQSSTSQVAQQQAA